MVAVIEMVCEFESHFILYLLRLLHKLIQLAPGVKAWRTERFNGARKAAICDPQSAKILRAMAEGYDRNARALGD